MHSSIADIGTECWDRPAGVMDRKQQKSEASRSQLTLCKTSCTWSWIAFSISTLLTHRIW